MDDYHKPVILSRIVKTRSHFLVTSILIFEIKIKSYLKYIWLPKDFFLNMSLIHLKQSYSQLLHKKSFNYCIYFDLFISKSAFKRCWVESNAEVWLWCGTSAGICSLWNMVDILRKRQHSNQSMKWAATGEQLTSPSPQTVYPLPCWSTATCNL